MTIGEERTARLSHIHLNNIDYHVLNILRRDKRKRLTANEIHRIIRDNGKTWHKSYVVRRLSILRIFGLIDSPARGLYEITDEGKKIVKNSKNPINIAVFDKPKAIDKLPHLRDLDKKIISFLAKDKKTHTLSEIEQALNRDGKAHYYKTLISNRLRVLDLLGITDTGKRDEHTITYYGSEVYKALKKEKGGK